MKSKSKNKSLKIDYFLKKNTSFQNNMKPQMKDRLKSKWLLKTAGWFGVLFREEALRDAIWLNEKQQNSVRIRFLEPEFLVF